MGYSQGAQVVGDTLCGRDDKGFVNNTAPFTAPGWKLSMCFIFLLFNLTDLRRGLTIPVQVIAAIQYADLAFNTTDSFHIDNATTNGVFLRKNVTACDPFKPVLRSYCDAGDTWCAGAPDTPAGEAIHGSYVGIYGNETVDWVVGKYNAFRATTPV